MDWFVDGLDKELHDFIVDETNLVLYNQTYNFLKPYSFSEDAMEFIQYAIRILMVNPDIIFEELEKIYQPMQKECQANQILNFSTTNSFITNFIIDNFYTDDSFNIQMEDIDLPTDLDANALTIPPNGMNFNENSGTIILFDNSYLDNATDLSIAMTAAHEFIHIYLMHLYSQGQLLLTYPNYTDLNNAFQAFENNSSSENSSSLNNAMHNIYDDFLDEISDAVFNFATDNNIPDVTQDYCNKIVLGSHQNTSAFQALTPEQQTEYSTIANNEENGNDQSKGNKCN